MTDETAVCQEIPQTRPRLRVRLGFWLILGLLSTAIPEVPVQSSPFPFFSVWGVLVTTPLYTLHVLFLATLLVHLRRVSWQGLCFAGALFGLYEAYITKVLWYPDWAPGFCQFGEVVWLHVVLLVLWWHPLMAFGIPLLIADWGMTRSRGISGAIPERASGRIVRWRLHVMLAVMCGMSTAGGPLTGAWPIVSALANTGLLAGLILLWRRSGMHERYALADLLPGRTGLVVLGVLLGLVYLILTPLLLPYRLPGLIGHANILLLYAVFLALLWAAPKTHGDVSSQPREPVPSASFKRILILFGWYVSVVIIIRLPLMAAGNPELTKIVGGVALMANWVVGGLIGLWVYGRAAITTVKSLKNPKPGPMVEL